MATKPTQILAHTPQQGERVVKKGEITGKGESFFLERELETNKQTNEHTEKRKARKETQKRTAKSQKLQ